MFEITLSLHLLTHNELSAEAAVGAELRSSPRRTERAGTRRESGMLNDRSSAKVGLETENIGADPDLRAVRAGSNARVDRPLDAGARDACRTWHRRGACGQHRHGADNVCDGSRQPRQS